jgi:hypothetical protein
MKVMYWNCTTPASAGNQFVNEKLAIQGAIVQTIDPDILCLDEVSAGVFDGPSANTFSTNHLNGAYGNPSVIVNPGIHLNTVAYSKGGTSDVKMEQGLPTDKWNSQGTKRDLTRCLFRHGTRDVAVWFLHANASRSGGNLATALACDSVKNKYCCVIGDFNYPIGHVDGATTVAPKVDQFNFTQWRTNPYGSANAPGPNPPLKYDPNAIIDFAIFEGKALKLTAIDTIGHLNANQQRLIFRYFDHFPIAYDITTL